MFLKIADLIVFNLLKMEDGAKLTHSVHFFIYDVIKILCLLFLIITIISFLRSYIDNEKFKAFVEKQPKPLAYLLGALFGAITPFCSCSSVPIFIGFIEAGLPFGVAMTFIITSPMINEIAILVLASTLGLKITVVYVVTGICVGIIGGLVMENLGMKKYLRDDIFEDKKCKCKGVSEAGKVIINYKKRIAESFDYARGILKKVWLFVIIGVGVGAAIHGYVPQEFFIEHLSKANIFAVPLAVLAGIPLYSDATGIIPVAEVLIKKGMAVGTVLAMMMAIVGISMPEMVILSRVMKKELITRFVLYMFISFTAVGYFYNYIF